jgi:hypothetical protein
MMLRAVVVLLCVLLAAFEAQAATSYPVTVGGATMVADGLDCQSIGHAVGQWAMATTVRTGAGGADPQAYAVASCTFNASTGVASNVSVAYNRNRAVVYVGGAVTATAKDFWFDDPVDPVTFAAWFAYVFVTTVSLYLTVRGIGWIVDLLRA